MSIQIDESAGIFTLYTRNSAYQMKVSETGFLLHTYYGRRTAQTDFSYLTRNYDRGFSGNPYDTQDDRTFSLDTALQEYTSCAEGDFRVGTTGVVNPDGSFNAEFRFDSFRVLPGKYRIDCLPSSFGTSEEADTLVITLKDRYTGLAADLYYGVFEATDMIARAAVLRNTGTQEILLTKALSACLDLSEGAEEIIHFHGRHCMERQPERCPIPNAVMTISSVRGMSSHHHNPFVILLRHDTTEDFGDCWGSMLVYSGNHRTDIERDQMGMVRLVTGIHDADFSWRLAPGEEFRTPEVLFSYSFQGLTKLSQQYHAHILNHISRSPFTRKERPVLLNSWEASYFDFHEEGILRLASQAKDLGMDLFVLDDGWFGKRNDDKRSLGDWFVNSEKLPHGLPYLSEKIHAIGLQFGLWIEPEMICEDSDLFRAHPDWAIRVPGRPPVVARNQLVLDLSRREVVDYLYDLFHKLICEAKIDYIKWDMNRPVSGWYSRDRKAEAQGETAHRYMLGVYQLMDRLTAAFPDVLFEGCAGGGGRFDAGILQYSPQIWCSDDSDAIARLAIQYGTSFGYPVSAMGAHVSACPNHQTGRDVPLHTRAVIAMSGTFGCELDPDHLSEAEKEEIRRETARFRKYRHLIHNGLYYRLSSPFDSCGYTAWQFVSEDRSESLLNVVITDSKANAPLIHLRLKGLDPDSLYQIEGEKEPILGSALLYGGYTLPLISGNYPAVQIFLKRISR